MNTIDKIKYILEICRIDSTHVRIVDIVSINSVKGIMQCNDNEDDYFDHYYMDSYVCDLYDQGDLYYPIMDDNNNYLHVEYIG